MQVQKEQYEAMIGMIKKSKVYDDDWGKRTLEWRLLLQNTSMILTSQCSKCQEELKERKALAWMPSNGIVHVVYVGWRCNLHKRQKRSWKYIDTKWKWCKCLGGLPCNWWAWQDDGHFARCKVVSKSIYHHADSWHEETTVTLPTLPPKWFWKWRYL